MANVVDVAVVGAGVAGLIAANTTARMGLTTTLFEAAPEVGGRAQTRSHDGFCFNQGPHALYVSGHFYRALDALGVNVPGHRLQLSGALALWSGETHPLPLDFETMQRAAPLDELDRLELKKIFREIAHSNYDCAGQALTTFTDRLRPRVSSLINALMRLVTYTHAPDLIDARAALDQFRLSLGGVLYLDGGWGALAAGLAASATAAGASVRTQNSVTSIARRGADWMVSGPGVEEHRASTVVLAVAPGEAVKLVRQSGNLAAAARSTKPVRLICLDLGLSKLPNPGTTFVIGVDQPTYFSVHSTTARLAPDGGALVHTARYLPPDETPRPHHLDGLKELADLLQPGWRDAEVRRQRLAGIVVAHDFPQFTKRGQRSPVTVHDAPGLFLAGDWIGTEGMLSDASAASAQAAARAVGEYMRQRSAGETVQ